MLPNQMKQFIYPYVRITLIINALMYTIYLIVWFIIHGSVPIYIIILMVPIPLEIGLINAILEWKFPILNWNVESDLYHHPRKYILPVIIMIEAGLVAAFFLN